MFSFVIYQGKNMQTPAIKFHKDELKIIDQTLLPLQLTYIPIRSIQDCVEAIKELKVRGAPAIGICAAYGLYIIAKSHADESFDSFKQAVSLREVLFFPELFEYQS